MYAKSTRPSAAIESRAPGALKLASDDNVPAKRADFLFYYLAKFDLF